MEEVKLSNPPIKESIFIIRFRELLQQNQLEDFINSEYVSSTFDIQELSQIPKESLFEKLRKGLVTKADSSRVLKLNLDSFSYHRLRYVSFEDLYLEFESLWNIFREHASLPPVQSISLRYINLIEAYEEKFDIRNYVKVFVSNPFEVDLSNFFLQIIVNKKEDPDVKAAVIETIRNDDGGKGIIIDINVQKDVRLKIDNQSTKDVFYSLREFKNYLFFNTVTPYALQQYV